MRVEKNRDRDLGILRDYRAGVTVKSLIQTCHLKKQRIYQIIHEQQAEEEREKRFDEAHRELRCGGSVSVKDVGFSNRVLKVLKAVGIETTDELMKTPAIELLKMRSFGRKSYDEVRAFARRYDYDFPTYFRGESKWPSVTEQADSS